MYGAGVSEVVTYLDVSPRPAVGLRIQPMATVASARPQKADNVLDNRQWNSSSKTQGQQQQARATLNPDQRQGHWQHEAEIPVRSRPKTAVASPKQAPGGAKKSVSILDGPPSAARRRAMITAAYGSPAPLVSHPFSDRKAPPTLLTGGNRDTSLPAGRKVRPQSAHAFSSPGGTASGAVHSSSFQWEGDSSPSPAPANPFAPRYQAEYLSPRGDFGAPSPRAFNGLMSAPNMAAPNAFTVPLGHTHDVSQKLITREDLIAAKAAELGNHVVPGAPTARLVGSTWKQVDELGPGSLQGGGSSNHLKKKDLTAEDLARTKETTLGQHVVPGSANARLVGGTWRYVPNASKTRPAFTE